MRRSNIWQAVVAAIIVATGLAVVWGLLAGWMVSMGQTLARSRDVQENILVAADGTPVISADSNVLSNNVPLSRRTLDGKSFPIDYEYWLLDANLQAHNWPPGVVRLPFPWNWGGRVGGYTDGRKPPAGWYVIRDDRPAAHCYLAGFDAVSKLPIGYIGRNGFRSNPPPLDEQFALPEIFARQITQFVASPQYFQLWGVVMYHNLGRTEPNNLPQWLAYIAEADRVWEIDLRQRTAKVALKIPDIVSIDGSLRALKKTVLNEPAEKTAAVPAVATADADKNAKMPEYANALAVRTDSKIVLRTAAGTLKEFTLPQQVPNNGIGVYWIAPEQLLLTFGAGEWSGGSIQRLLWIDPAGKVQRNAEVKLAGWRPESPRENAWIGFVIVPVTIVWFVGIVLGAPLVMLQNYVETSYFNAIRHTIEVAWPPLILVLALAAVFTWLTVRLQRKYHRPHTGLWAAFVFLLGLPGFAAYLMEQRQTKLEACAECGQIVPRDREACAACNAEFAPPARVGTEIFA
jgi:hypothetical protein